jgi:hypothetical protein
MTETIERGRLMPLTSFVSMTSCMNIIGIIFRPMLDKDPKTPHIDIGRRSKLKIYAIKTVPKNY